MILAVTGRRTYQSVHFCQYEIHSAAELIFPVNPGRLRRRFCALSWNFARGHDVIPPPGKRSTRISARAEPFRLTAGGLRLLGASAERIPPSLPDFGAVVIENDFARGREGHEDPRRLRGRGEPDMTQRTVGRFLAGQPWQSPSPSPAPRRPAPSPGRPRRASGAGCPTSSPAGESLRESWCISRTGGSAPGRPYWSQKLEVVSIPTATRSLAPAARPRGRDREMHGFERSRGLRRS